MDSMFFKPAQTSAAAMTSQLSDASQLGLRQSTFNLGDLVPDSFSEERQQAAGSEDEHHARMTSSMFNMAETDNFSAASSQTRTAPADTERMFVSAASPVYLDASGEGVTDLAFHVPLDQVAHNPFDDATLPLTAANITATGQEITAADLASMTFNSADFKSGSQFKTVHNNNDRSYMCLINTKW